MNKYYFDTTKYYFDEYIGSLGEDINYEATIKLQPLFSTVDFLNQNPYLIHRSVIAHHLSMVCSDERGLNQKHLKKGETLKSLIRPIDKAL